MRGSVQGQRERAGENEAMRTDAAATLDRAAAGQCAAEWRWRSVGRCGPGHRVRAAGACVSAGSRGAGLKMAMESCISSRRRITCVE
uniref:Uncharacterized protein n=1 Tax=Setaria viridis TaxID=4556 RepID=A0A4U6W9S3_SETVI|nr:hypothetical protein SEVIR_1G180300v2 [Setaria viridis]